MLSFISTVVYSIYVKKKRETYSPSKSISLYSYDFIYITSKKKVAQATFFRKIEILH